MSTEITIGSCKSFEDLYRTNYDFNAVVDRLYNLLGEVPEAPFDGVLYIVNWKLSDGDAEYALIRVKYRDKGVDEFTDNPEDLYACWDVPARYLFMTEQEIVADWKRKQEELERQFQEYQQQLEAEQEQKQYQEFLRLKAIYEPEDSNDHPND